MAKQEKSKSLQGRHKSGRAKTKKAVISLYGNIAIPRGYCKYCDSMAFINNGLLACCDSPVDMNPKKFKRESEPPQFRRLPPVKKRREILENQNNCCFYCGIEFGVIRYRKGRPFTIKHHWDHKLPYAYCQNNSETNFVAACHVCNGLKSDRVFRDLEEIQVFLVLRRKEEGYDF